MTASEFLIKYYPYAKESESRSKIPAFFILAQAGIESRWGNSAPGNNFFGKKAFSSWKGATQKLKTWECGKTGDPVKDGISDEIIKIYPPGSPEGNGSCNSGGKYSYRVYGKFKAYATPLEGFLDHSNFLLTNSRYKKAFEFLNSPEEFARQIAKAGYATAPNYAEVLVNSISQVKKLYELNRDKILSSLPIVPMINVIPGLPPVPSLPSGGIEPWVYWTVGGLVLAGIGTAIYYKRKKAIL